MKCVCKTVVWILIIAAIWISNLLHNCFILNHFHQWEIAIAWCICVPIGIFQWRNLFSSHILLYFGDRKEFFLPDRLVYKLEWNVFFAQSILFWNVYFFWIIFSSQFVRSNYYSSYSENIPKEFDGTLYGDVYNWVDLIQNYIQQLTV